MASQKDRRDKVRDAVRNVLREGERFVVSKEGDEVQVASAPAAGVVSPLHASHQELYAALLRADDRIERAGGCGFIGLFPVCLWILIAAVDTLGVADLLSFTTTVIAGLIGLWIGLYLSSLLERRAWRRVREGVLDAIRRGGLSMDDVLVAIHGDKAVEHAGRFLKREGAAGG